MLAASFVLLATLIGGRVHAQVGFPYVPPATSPFARPVVSPYLNLALPGNPGINYFGLVRPQLQTVNALNQLQTQYTTLDQQLLATQAGGTPGYPLLTGHRSAFLNHYGYFQNWRTGTIGGGYPGAGYGTTGFGTTGLPGQNVGFGAVTFGRGPSAPASQPAPGPKPPPR
jgi:hypothetical protein